MRRVVFVMTILFIVFSVTIALGQTPLNQENQKILNQGNEAFAKGDYESAKTLYKSLLGDKNFEDSVKYNLGIIAYKTQAYDEALEYLKDIDDYKLYGNTYYKMGQIAEKRQDKISCYEEATKRYMSGIKTEPNNVELKYNYEFVKKILDDLNEEQKEEEKKQEENNQDNEDDNKDKNDSKGDSKDDENQDNQDEQGNQGDKEEDKKQDSQDSSKSEDDKGKEDSESNPSDKDDENKSDESKQGGVDKINGDDETIQQILKLLEQQEKQSLKNNQGIMEQGKEEGNDW